jgi:hypothetical protein
VALSGPRLEVVAEHVDAVEDLVVGTVVAASCEDRHLVAGVDEQPGRLPDVAPRPARTRAGIES